MNREELELNRSKLQNRIYLHMLIFIFIVILIDAFAVDNGIRLIEGMWGHVLFVAVIITLLYQEMIFRSLIEYDDRRTLRLFTFLGVMGVILFIWGIVDIMINGFIPGDFIVSKKIAELLTAVCWCSIGLAYWVQRKHFCKVKME